MKLTLHNVLLALKASRLSQMKFAAALQEAKRVQSASEVPSDPVEAAEFTAKAVAEIQAIKNNVEVAETLISEFLVADVRSIPVGGDGEETFNSLREERNMLFICNCSMINSMEGCNAYRTMLGNVPAPAEESSPEMDALRSAVGEAPVVEREEVFFLGYIVPDNEIPSAGMNLPMSLWHLCDFAEIIERESLSDFLIVASL